MNVRCAGRPWFLAAGWIGWLLLLPGTLGFLWSAVAFSLVPLGPFPALQFPVPTICGTSWDPVDEVVLVGLCNFSRIQAYSDSGAFRWGWFVPAYGRFTLDAVAPGLHLVRTERRRLALYYDGTGLRQAGPPATPVRAERAQSFQSKEAAPELVVTSTGSTMRVEVLRDGEILGRISSSTAARVLTSAPTAIGAGLGLLLLYLRRRWAAQPS